VPSTCVPAHLTLHEDPTPLARIRDEYYFLIVVNKLMCLMESVTGEVDVGSLVHAHNPIDLPDTYTLKWVQSFHKLLLESSWDPEPSSLRTALPGDSVLSILEAVSKLLIAETTLLQEWRAGNMDVMFLSWMDSLC
jgi:hypothetical protein